MRTRVKRDLITGRWRVTCDLHKDVSRWGNFWSAMRDARAHDEVCELWAEDEKGPPEEDGGNPPAGH